MDEIGHILREARENKGLSLEDIQDKTRINMRFLAALESGQYDRLPTPVHARGFLRNYARALGLDAQPLLDRYQAAVGNGMPIPSVSHDITPDSPLPERQDQPFFDPVNLEVAGKGLDGASSSSGIGTGGLLQIALIIALVVALALIANRFIPMLFGSGGGDNAVQEIGTAVQEVLAEVAGTTATAMPAADDPQSTEEPGLVIGGTPIANTSRNNPDATPSPTRPPLPATLDEIRLKLEILERTWLELTIDGNVVYSGIARAEEVLEYTAEQDAKLVTGNAIGIFLTLNDIALGRLGGRGEQYEETWRTTQ